MRLAVTAERAACWLTRAWAEREADDATLAMDALALGHLCRVLSPGASGAVRELENAIARAVPEPAWASASLLTALVAAAGAAGEGSALASSAEQYLQALDELCDPTASGANDVLLRLASREAVRDAGDELHIDSAAWPGRADDVRAFVERIEAWTAFGTAAVRVDAPLPLLLEGAALTAFRAYDLPHGMRLLRARLYVCAERSPGTSAGLDFLRSIQCDDGSFGDYDTPLAQLKARGAHNALLQLKAPIAMQALWTMAEMETPAFRLVHAALAPLRMAKC